MVVCCGHYIKNSRKKHQTQPYFVVLPAYICEFQNLINHDKERIHYPS